MDCHHADHGAVSSGTPYSLAMIISISGQYTGDHVDMTPFMTADIIRLCQYIMCRVVSHSECQ